MLGKTIARLEEKLQVIARTMWGKRSVISILRSVHGYANASCPKSSLVDRRQGAALFNPNDLVPVTGWEENGWRLSRLVRLLALILRRLVAPDD